ncbi:DUF1672 domain-containing protein [Bacillus haynesii]|uniref:DUF1672 family protein n=1 Tax=Bacillus haynesii TaxID=1925021 RepID=UPI00227E8EB6|nr:DUF1672 family protein [Bacillus haynesii]MCY7770659.1 DUF1672 domain-containing protein [Bacillus haynesii]MCY8012206.1 DUF1672 domain-containing protein [Bacillus haynesii]MCY8347779.1 DUF1672 domain-containing protein [Bacillus haynesii]MCY8350572.1 DUF1672 domain-containing protein [Bacillus haynesii]MCY8561135.1 DUF1672 domain-containing protein [Bacillus haynesii]
MKFKKILTLSIGIPMLLGGCMNLDLWNHDRNSDKTEANNSQAEYNQNLIRVQDYTGQGYALDGGQATAEIAKAHHEEIEKAVKTFFLEKYKTKVKVHNIVGALNAASVFVESEGEPHFHTYAVVPIDVKNKEVLLDKVWSQEGQVEGAITSGIYAMVFEKELGKLDDYLKKVANKNPVIGINQEAVNKVGGSGYSTTFYYITITDDNLDKIYLEYLKRPKKSKEEWKTELKRTDINPKRCYITIHLYMENAKAEPDKHIFDQVVKGIENMNGLAPGSYSILLHDNTINKRVGSNSKENTLERSIPNIIIKP